MHGTGSPNKVSWATRSEVLGLRSPTIEFLKLLSLPVLLESPNNGEAGPLVSFQRRTGGSGNCLGPELEGEKAGPGPRLPDSLPRFFTLGTACALTLILRRCSALGVLGTDK